MRIRVLLLRLCLLLAPLLSYSSAVSNGFVWDDHHTIERGQLIGDPRNIPQLYFHDTMFNSSGTTHAQTAQVDTYRPLTMTTLFLDHAIYGKRPLGYHLTSVLLHSLNVWLVFALGVLLQLPQGAATAAALIFAVHPSISEAVHWINGRSDPLCLFFYLCGACMWLGLRQTDADGQRRRVARAAGAAALFFCATLCKETAFLLVPPLLLLLGRASRRTWLLAAIPIGVGLALGWLCRHLALGRAAVAGGGSHLLHGIARLPAVWFDALRSVFMPAPDHLPSLFERYHLMTAWRTLGLVPILLLCGFAAWRLYRGRPLLAWALTTLLASMAPVTLLTYDEGWTGWGRYLYAGMAPMALWIAAEVRALMDTRPPAWLRAAPIATGLALVALGAQTYRDGASWQDDRALGQAEVRDHPESSGGYVTLASEDIRTGRYIEGLALIDKARKMAPAPIPRHSSLAAWALMKLGKYTEAYAAAHQTLAMLPRDQRARYIYALELLNHGPESQPKAALMLLGLMTEDPSFNPPWRTVQSVLTGYGPQTPFAQTLRRALEDPRYQHIAPRLLPLFVAPTATGSTGH